MALENLLKRFVKAGLQVGLNFVKNHPKIRLYVIAVVRKLRLDGIVRSVYMRLTVGAYSLAMGLKNHRTKEMSHHTPRTRQIYADLKAAIERRQKEGR